MGSEGGDGVGRRRDSQAFPWVLSLYFWAHSRLLLQGTLQFSEGTGL